MNFSVWLNILILGAPFKHSIFWCWYRLINHEDYRLDDRYRYADFWYKLNEGYHSMEYEAFVRNTPESSMFVSSPDVPDTIYVNEETYNKLIEKIENPDPPTPFLRQLLSKPAPWED